MTEYEKGLHTPTANNTSSKPLSKGDIELQSPTAEVRFQDEKIVGDPYGKGASARKYSVFWWKETWNGAIRTGGWPRLVYCGIGVVFLGVWIGIMLGFVRSEIIYEDKNLQTRAHPRDFGDSDIQFIILKGSLINFDVDKRTLAVSWSALYTKNVSKPPVEFGDLDDPNSLKFVYGLEIYRDVSSEPVNLTYQDEGDPTVHWAWTYQIDNRTAKPIGEIGMHPWDGFDTDITFTQKHPKNVWLQPQLGYPFDQWHGEIVFVANNPGLAEMFNSKGSGVMEIGGIQLTDSTLNWRFSYKFNNTCAGSNSNTVVDLLTLDENTLPRSCHNKIEFDGTRPPLLIFCAIAAVVVNWTCAIFIFILTCEAIVMRRSYMLKGTDILSMCFTALFALPTIRLLLPGAPAYGAIIDLVGILPCTLVVALCAVCVSVAKLNKRSKIEKQE
ncbi:hypothetical protein FRC14_000449 [Serendipita sp. 396]|nr:hypothetical protein FRC14_000449 [Serendipita sp. 396]KAG8775552.1 hypothetical protein FRC15_000458 [Serendipita sp. 397]KAG8790300.1 hypothetical protein FRC16_000911 [Serendipita sp. 398]